MGDGVMGYLRDKFKGTNTGRALTEREKALQGDVEQASTPAPAPKPAPKPSSSADPETQRLLDKYKNLSRGAVIPGHDTKGKDDVSVNVTRGEAVLPVNTVDAMGGPGAVRSLIHKTNGKPAIGARRGGKYADGMVDDVFAPGGWKKAKLGADSDNPIASYIKRPPFEKVEYADGRVGTGAKKPVATPSAYEAELIAKNNAVLQGDNKGTIVKPVMRPSDLPTTPSTGDANMPARDPNAPVGDQRLAALGVRGNWDKMTEAAGRPIERATIYRDPNSNSAAGYGTQTPEQTAADASRAKAHHEALMGTYERESQARLGARVAQARAQGEDAYADKLQKELDVKSAAATADTGAKAALAAQEGVGALRGAQAQQAQQAVAVSAEDQAQNKTLMADMQKALDAGDTKTYTSKLKLLMAKQGKEPQDRSAQELEAFIQYQKAHNSNLDPNKGAPMTLPEFRQVVRSEPAPSKVFVPTDLNDFIEKARAENIDVPEKDLTMYYNMVYGKK